MPESRDRLSRADDVRAWFPRRRRMIDAGIAILPDEPEVGVGTRFRWGATPMTDPHQHVAALATRGGGAGRTGNRTNTDTARAGLVRNTNRRASGLPTWYPRRPLRDITAVVRAIERRRARLGVTEGQETGSPARVQDQDDENPQFPLTDAHLEHNSYMITPKPFAAAGRNPTEQNTEDSDSLTPQKKRIKFLDMLLKVLKEECEKQQTTPAAKKEETDRRIRTLMSMR